MGIPYSNYAPTMGFVQEIPTFFYDSVISEEKSTPGGLKRV
jgi:hypothetical protein